MCFLFIGQEASLGTTCGTTSAYAFWSYSLSIRCHMIKCAHSILNLGQVILRGSMQPTVMRVVLRVEHDGYGYTIHPLLYDPFGRSRSLKPWSRLTAFHHVIKYMILFQNIFPSFSDQNNFI